MSISRSNKGVETMKENDLRKEKERKKEKGDLISCLASI